ncbi:MAG: FAD-binding oxidoreductase [Chitinophagales bacterium]|nr:FAD-binding oxidoreductase [Chitinophagales bacterium]
MLVDYLIIGQGIAGTWLSYFLSKTDKTFLVIDEADPSSSSRVAAGLINPVTGRRVVKTWMIDELLPFAEKQYDRMGADLGINAISRKPILDFFSAPDIKIAFESRLEKGEDYISKGPDDLLSHFFHPGFGCGIIDPAYTVHLDKLLPAWQKRLEEKGQLRKERFEENELVVNQDSITYRDIIAHRIIYCDGAEASQSRFFSRLPFAMHKGEALILEIPDLPKENIYKKGLTLVPLSGDNLFWLGSNYIWEFDNALPTEGYRAVAIQKLDNWLKLPYKILDHKAAVRPATIERRPFIGLHPLYPVVGIFNGMGTKGCSLTPYFGDQFVQHLVKGNELMPLVDVGRFGRVLRLG